MNSSQSISVASGIKDLVHFPEVLHITQNAGESHFQGKKKVGVIVILSLFSWLSQGFLSPIHTNIMNGVNSYNVAKSWW